MDGGKRYNPRKRKMRRKQYPMKHVWLVVLVASCLIGYAELSAPAAPSKWGQPAAALADQIAGILGPGQARLTIRNLSTISTEEIPAIRLLLEQDLKARGVLASGAESANAIRVTLSENIRERLWVAEVIEGSERQVAMVHVEPELARPAQAGTGLTLRKETVLATKDPVLAALETGGGLVVVEPEEIVIYGHATEGWAEVKRVAIGQRRPLVRDPRGVIFQVSEDGGFEAFVAGTACTGSYQAAQPTGEWTIHCLESDDPWTIVQPPDTQTRDGTKGAATPMDLSVLPFRAFYNAARNYFTGVINFSNEVETPPFYSAAQIVRSASSAPLLLNGVDGKIQLQEDGVLKPVSGTRDWGSDFAVLHAGCGTGTQIVASGSGEALADSLRAYDLPAQEAIPASAPLAMEGTVMALWNAPDNKSVFAAVRRPGNRDAGKQFEVDRVTASCN
jgi:hypothetical protein